LNITKRIIGLVAGTLSLVQMALAQQDTLVVASGKIVSAETMEPVEARITYQSLPYGSRMGILNGDSYTFTLFDNSPYSITVSADGFAPSKYLFNPTDADANRKIFKDIALTKASATEGPNAIGTVMRLTSLIFEQGRSKINPSSFDELNRLSDLLKNNHQMVIQLEGHTDYLGNADQNMKLSEQRVDKVKDYLVKQGVHKGQVKTKAFGGTQPLSREDTPEAHSANRRVEVRILSN
jgi:outer membrane protein OmpA-like peptidoglycan-associated protein